MSNLDAMSVAELEAALESKRARLEELANRRSALAAELDDIDGELASLAGSAPKRRGRPPGTGAKAPGRPAKKRGGPRGPRLKNKLTMKAAVTQAIEESGDGLTLSETAAAVKALGYKSKSGNFENVVYQCLYNNPKLFPRGKDKKYRVKS